MNLYQQSEATAAYRRVFLHLVDATDGISAETGEAAGQPQISKNGAAFGNTSATLTAIGNGAYYVVLTDTELNTLGFIIVRYKSANTAEAQVMGQVVAFDPYDAVRAGLTALPNANAEAAGGLYTRGTGAGQINQNANGQVDSRTVAMDTGVVTAAAVATGAIDADALGADCITEAKIADDAIAAEHIATGAIVAATFGAGAIDAAAIAADAIGSSEFAQAAADKVWSTAARALTDKAGFSLAADQSAVTVGTVTTLTGHTAQTGDTYAALPTNFSDLAITVTTGYMTVGTVVADAINAAAIADGAIDAASFAAGAIDAAAIATGAIDADAIGADAITSAKIADDAIGADQIGAAAIVAATFGAGAIDASAIATDAIGSDELAATAVAEIANAVLPKKNAAFNNIVFLMVDDADHVTPETGASVSCQRSIDGGAFSAGTGTGPAEISNGMYQYDASQADMNGTNITFRFYASGADDTFVTIKTTD
jgi:hypothetical protein